MPKALFLDRDGVINEYRQYVARVEDFVWRDGIFELVTLARERDFLPIVVTNQTGIGLGYYSEKDFQDLTQWMCNAFEERGAALEKVYHCAHHPQAITEELRKDHPWRKPEPGMLLAARDDYDMDLSASIMIGDRWSDMLAGHRAGVGTLVLVGEPRDVAPLEPPEALRFETISDVARWFDRAAWN